MKELVQFVEMSRYAGERFDLVQAGGGNSSVKLDSGEMYIKASGYLLSEINYNKGYAIVNNSKVIDVITNKNVLSIKDKRERDKKASAEVLLTMVEEGPRPSIETFLHALLLKYTLHVHSIAVNILTSHKNWKEKVMLLGEDVLTIKYMTPGIDLAIEMNNQIHVYEKEKGKIPKIICLQNHGLIITSNKFSEIEEIMESVVIKAETLSNLDLEKYRLTTYLSKEINEFSKDNQITYLVNDFYLKEVLKTNKEYFSLKPFCPDGYVFCGYKSLELDETKSLGNQLKEYINNFKEVPKVLIYKNNIYIVAVDLKKAKMIEDVLKNNLLILESLGENINFLDEEEIQYLGNWDAEKYRQNL